MSQPPLEWVERMEARRAAMAAAGFPEGARVRALVDGSERLPHRSRYLAGYEGVVKLNMGARAGEEDFVTVLFDDAGPWAHVVSPHKVEVI